MTMAILGLLAWKAVKHFSASPAAARPGAGARQCRRRLPGGGAIGGGLGDVLKGGLGGLLAGGAAGSVISGGLGDLLKQLQQSGHGETANSWVGNGPNKPISPGDLANALGADQINGLIVAKRPVARRTADGPQPASAGGHQSSDAGRAAADRKRTVRPALMPAGGRLVELCFSEEGRSWR